MNGGSSWLTGQTHGKLLHVWKFQLYGPRYNGEYSLFLLRQDGGLRIVVKIFEKDVEIFTEKLGPGKVQMMKEKDRPALKCKKLLNLATML